MNRGDDRQVAWIVGFGGRTAVGSWAVASSAAVRAGISTFAQHPFMISKDGLPMIVARDRLLPAVALGIDRFIGLAVPAASEAVAGLGGSDVGPLMLRTFLGLPANRPGLPPDLAPKLWDRIAKAIAPRVRAAGPEVFASGHSAGLMALEAACRSIATGAADLCLVGGIESYLEPETLEWLDKGGRLHSETESWGLIPGEAAGFVVLASRAAAERLAVPVSGGILGVATALEKNPLGVDEPCLGEGLTEAFDQALDALPSRDSKVDFMIWDMNGEPNRADEFGYTLVRRSNRFTDASNFWTPADCWGDVGAASGPLFVILALAAELRGYSKGPHTLVWTSSDGGERSAAVVRTGKFSGD